MAALIGSNLAGQRRRRRLLRAFREDDVAQPDLRVVPPDGRLAEPLTPVVLSSTERIFRFRGMPQAVGAARRALHEWEIHFEPILFYDLALCVSELVTISVQQRDPADDDEAELEVRRASTVVHAEVREDRPDLVVRNPFAMNANDWGMFIVDRVADRWGVERHAGTSVWCEIDLAPGGRSRRSELAGGGRLPRSARV